VKIGGEVAKDDKRGGEEDGEGEWGRKSVGVVAQGHGRSPGGQTKAGNKEEAVDAGEGDGETQGTVSAGEPESQKGCDEGGKGKDDETSRLSGGETDGVDGGGEIGRGGADGEPAEKGSSVGPVGTEDQTHEIVRNDEANGSDGQREMREEVGSLSNGGGKIGRSGRKAGEAGSEHLRERCGDVCER